MKKSFYAKLAVVLILLILSMISLLPTIKLMTMSEEEQEQLSMQELEDLQANSINLGLDLKGGMHLVMEVDMDQLSENEKKDAVERALEVIRNRIDQFGVAEPLIQREGKNRIIVQLPGLSNPQRAKNLIGQTALLEFKIVQENKDANEVFQRIDKITAEKNLFEKYNLTRLEQETKKTDTETETENIEETPSSDFLEELSQDTQSDDSLEKDSAAATEADSALASQEDEISDSGTTEDTSAESMLDEIEEEEPTNQPFSSRLRRTGGGDFTNYFVAKDNYRLLDSLLKTEEVQNEIPADLEVAWSSTDDTLGIEKQVVRQIFVLTKKAEMTGSSVEDAMPNIGQGYDPSIANQPIVEFEVKKEAIKLFAQITGANVGKRLAIVLDNKVVSAPRINGKIPGGKSTITGSRDMQDAKDLSIVLRSGALPAPVNIIEERTVGATLGDDSIRMGKNAAIVGLILVMIFMIIYYKLAGIIADLALVLNMVFIMGAMAYLNAVLTLPGIAGLILTIGMAVDANVLIFERIREEINLGKPVGASVINGFDRARWTIVDSNITTLITALVLYNFGTGPIRGFAVTLSLGILSSMFTALIVSRLIFDFYITKTSPKKLSI